ncbi:AarF/UbiB family protein [Thauera humireducens]|uniref:AarF/UbiB family protein n=1 Tax=Thauera humireducens TaxID=1134435 RepID=UPI00311EE9FD
MVEPWHARARAPCAGRSGSDFIKLGQVLATRVDLFPPEWIAEFGKLQDAAPAAPFEAIRAQLTEDLGQAPETVFAELELAPLAAASLAQVHRARLADGAACRAEGSPPGYPSAGRGRPAPARAPG